MDGSTTVWILVGLAIVALMIAAVVASRHRARVRRLRVAQQVWPRIRPCCRGIRTGPRGPRARLREQRVEKFQARELSEADRARLLWRVGRAFNSNSSMIPGLPSVAPTSSSTNSCAPRLPNRTLRAARG